MSDFDLPEEVRSFIENDIPSVEAAELLLLLERHRARRFDVQTIINELRPTPLDDMTARATLSAFRERGLVVQMTDGSYQYYPVVPQLAPVVSAFAELYKEKPVTMMRAIYSLKHGRRAQASRKTGG